MLLLSYPIDRTTPAYGGGASPRIEQDKCQDHGDSCNTLSLQFSNHTGTHLDCPYHFDSSGKKLTDYPADFWFCKSVLFVEMLELPGPGHLIGPEDLRELVPSKGHDDAEALLLRTGYGDQRQSPAYTADPPGIHADLASWLRKRFPALRFFGFDLISISSFANREHGRISHRAFLAHDHPILPIEDMDLRSLKKDDELTSLLVSPLWIRDADGSPCSVWANVS